MSFSRRRDGLSHLNEIIRRFFESQFYDKERWHWQPTKCHVVFYCWRVFNHLQNGQLKLGMSEYDCMGRILEQYDDGGDIVFAVLVLTLDGERHLGPQHIVNDVKQLHLPGHCTHQDNEGRLDDLTISDYNFAKVSFACAHRCGPHALSVNGLCNSPATRL